MSGLSGKYEVRETEGVNCAIVEQGITMERAQFLKTLLEHNRFTVHIAEMPAPKTATENTTPTPVTYVIGVTDITFNIALALFNRHLRTLDNKILLPHYWFTGHQGKENYWEETLN
jgi:hypothetical protein